MPHENTSVQVLKIARDLLASDGLSAVSFDAIARRLGRTKQAVLYWYPTKHDLLAAMFLPWLEAEADTAIRSVMNMHTRDEAIEAFVKAIAGFHLDDLGRFRMMYLLPQTIKPSAAEPENAEFLAKVHPVTDKIYGALAEKLGGDLVAMRREAFAIHSAIMGLVLMFGLAESLRDPLKYTVSEALDAMIASLRTA